MPDKISNVKAKIQIDNGKAKIQDKEARDVTRLKRSWKIWLVISLSLFARHRLSEPLDGFASEFKLRIRCTLV